MTQYDDHVFINCPFTPDYKSLLQAIVFAVADCGFVPRCALESSDFTEPRIEKIVRIISECRYGIHDISATEVDPANSLPRFNMPLELGIFLGSQRFGSPKHRKKACLVLDRERYRYQKFCSDIAGQDPKAHNGDPNMAIKCIRDWLRGERPTMRYPSGKRMGKRYASFRDDLPDLCTITGFDQDDLTINDLKVVTEEWLSKNPW